MGWHTLDNQVARLLIWSALYRRKDITCADTRPSGREGILCAGVLSGCKENLTFFHAN